MALLATLIHNDDNASDWEDYETGNGVTTTNDTEITTTYSADGSSQYAFRQTVASTWSLDESSIYLRMKQRGTCTGTERIYNLFRLSYDADNYAEWEIDPYGVLRAYQLIATVKTQKGSGLTFGATYEWLRIRETGGTVYWDTAPDSGSGTPGTWTNRATSTDAIQLSNLQVQIGVFQNYDGATVYTDAIWDSVNESPASGGGSAAVTPRAHFLRQQQGVS